MSVSDQLAKAKGSSIVIPCEFSSDTLHREGISVVWKRIRNSEISVLATFNGTSHSYQPRVRINQRDFSLLLSDLTTSDSGEYLCNMSTPHYTKLTVRTLEVGKLLLLPYQRVGTNEGNTGPESTRNL